MNQDQVRALIRKHFGDFQSGDLDWKVTNDRSGTVIDVLVRPTHAIQHIDLRVAISLPQTVPTIEGQGDIFKPC